MDRRLPTQFTRFRRASVASVAAWWLVVPASFAADAEATAIPMSTSGSAVGGVGAAWIPAVVLVGCLALAGWLWFRRKQGQLRGTAGGIAVIDRAPMGGGRSLALVKVGDRVVLVGESAQGFQRLAEFAADEADSKAHLPERLAS
jgi:flagellar biogenesis protein FliO